jgi:hypothetical protein
MAAGTEFLRIFLILFLLSGPGVHFVRADHRVAAAESFLFHVLDVDGSSFLLADDCFDFAGDGLLGVVESTL